MEDHGVFCGTAGTYFQERETLSEHYKSEFHRYNLKRKVAGLPPVTREWYEARRSQLISSSGTPIQKTWFDPLTRKKFYSENTFLAYTRSKKYLDIVKKSDEAAPAPIITVKRIDDKGAVANSEPTQQHTQGYTVKPAVKSKGATMQIDDSKEEGSDWETASDEDGEEGDEDSMLKVEGSVHKNEQQEGEGEEWEEWEVNMSLFDNHVSSNFAANLEYMWRHFGFYIPDAHYCVDPEGLVKYLGVKLQYGHMPLYESGDNPNAKSFNSLHAVQRHMIDSGKCKILYDGNEDEYEDFYDYSSSGANESMEVDGGDRIVSQALILHPDDALELAAGGYELSIPGTHKIIGNREFARYYKQKHRLADGRASAAAAAVVQAHYRRLSVPLLGDGTESGSTALQAKKAEERSKRIVERSRLRMSIRRNVNDNLPKNVPY